MVSLTVKSQLISIDHTIGFIYKLKKMQLYWYLQPNSYLQCEREANLHIAGKNLILMNIC